MKILQFHAENVKRLKVVDITPTADVVVISGMNENGKSSVIDAMWLALSNRAASKNITEPLRNGEKKGIVTLDLGDYIVTRRFTENDSTLEVRTPEGNKVSSPQKLLDGLVSDLSFDPWEFARKDEKEQREMLGDILFKLTGGKLDLTAYEVRKKTAYDARTDANRERKNLVSLLTNICPPTGSDPTEEISSVELAASITDAIQTKGKVDSLERSMARNKTDITNQLELIAKAQKLIENLEKDNQRLSEELSNIHVEDVAFLQDQLKNIEVNNKRAREVIEYHKLRTALDGVDEAIKALNNEIELVEIEKAEALEASPLPIKGFTINAEGVRIINEDGSESPFNQASSARKLTISLAIAMAANPTLRVIRISDGSLLDDASMAIIREMAKDNDYQVWVEYASRNDQDRMGVYIEDGTVVALV